MTARSILFLMTTCAVLNACSTVSQRTVSGDQASVLKNSAFLTGERKHFEITNPNISKSRNSLQKPEIALYVAPGDEILYVESDSRDAMSGSKYGGIIHYYHSLDSGREMMGNVDRAAIDKIKSSYKKIEFSNDVLFPDMTCSELLFGCAVDPVNYRAIAATKINYKNSNSFGTIVVESVDLSAKVRPYLQALRSGAWKTGNVPAKRDDLFTVMLSDFAKDDLKKIVFESPSASEYKALEAAMARMGMGSLGLFWSNLLRSDLTPSELRQVMTVAMEPGVKAQAGGKLARILLEEAKRNDTDGSVLRRYIADNPTSPLIEEARRLVASREEAQRQAAQAARNRVLEAERRARDEQERRARGASSVIVSAEMTGLGMLLKSLKITNVTYSGTSTIDYEQSPGFITDSSSVVFINPGYRDRTTGRYRYVATFGGFGKTEICSGTISVSGRNPNLALRFYSGCTDAGTSEF